MAKYASEIAFCNSKLELRSGGKDYQTKKSGTRRTSSGWDAGQFFSMYQREREFSFHYYLKYLDLSSNVTIADEDANIVSWRNWNSIVDKYCEIQPLVSISWEAVSSICCFFRLYPVWQYLHLFPLYDVKNHTISFLKAYHLVIIRQRHVKRQRQKKPMLQTPNLCYTFDKEGVEGYQIWHFL